MQLIKRVPSPCVAFFFLMMIISDSLSATNSLSNIPEGGAELNSIVEQTADPRQIRTNLQAVFDENLLDCAGKTNWAKIRFNAALTVLTNLFQLETELQKTALAMRIKASPPVGVDPDFLPDIQPPNSDPDLRKKVEVYMAKKKAIARAWNLHQSLEVEYQRHWKKAIDFVVDAYSSPPLADAEIKQLLSVYSGHDFVLQISNNLFPARKQHESN